MIISIITVSYNSDKTIEKTIKSVSAQTYSKIEYIIVDGGSSDNTVRIIQDNEEYIDKWISEPDRGLYDAMNKGVKIATGKIIGILNSDDIFIDNDVIKNIAKFHLHNNIEASVGNITQFNNSGKTVRLYSSKKWNPSTGICHPGG